MAVSYTHLDVKECAQVLKMTDYDKAVRFLKETLAGGRIDGAEVLSCLLYTSYIIRCSDGWMGCTSEGYEMAVQLAQEHIEGTDLTYVII